MLTVALLLGSKFLDDNTFQNRSWSDVSGIAVSELNTMENEWLKQIGWALYVNLDQSHDYNAWLKSWKDWEENKKFHQLQQQQQQQQQSHIAMRERLAPLVTNMHSESVRHHPLAYQGWTPEEIVDHERFNMNARFPHAGQNAYRGREGSWAGQYSNPWSQPQAPMTPPDSGYGTPEYLNSAASVNASYDEWFAQAVSGGYGRHFKPPGHTGYGSRTGAHFSSYHHNFGGTGPWEANGECLCNSCRSQIHNKTGPYFQQHGYTQAVMG